MVEASTTTATSAALEEECREEVCAMTEEEEVVYSMNHDADMWITIDSGASENVISEKLAPQFRTRPARGSRGDVKYVTANGSVMSNQGEKEVKVRTKEGHRCMLRMQVTDVQKPLMSVPRICDAGHRVIFTKQGGHIEHEESGQKTEFVRENNVYRLKVEMAGGEEAVFGRRGR